jgi:SPP1 Gp6-like portal protein
VAVVTLDSVRPGKETALWWLERLYGALAARAPRLATYNAYYEGRHPLHFASPQFEKYWAQQYSSMADNWCQVVVDSKSERLVVRGIRIGEEAADKDLWRVWQINGLDADSGLAFVDAIAGCQAYALVWGDPDDDDTPVVSFESAEEAIIAYEPGSRRKKLAGLKCWRDEYTGDEFATLYLPDWVWRFEKKGGVVPDILPRDPDLGSPLAWGGPGAWELREVRGEPNPMPNPMGEVPLAELPNRSRLARDPVSEIANVIPLQDAINTVWTHLLTASDFASFPQRVVMGMQLPKKPVQNENGDVVGQEPIDLEKFAVDRVLWFEGPDAKIGSWPAANLENYTKLLETAVGHIAAQTRTPQHYLIGKMANLSGEALKAAETGLVSTVYEKQLYFGEAIKDMARLIALAQDNLGKAQDLREASVIWKDPESRSLAELADSLGKQAVMLHVPDEALWREYGYTDIQIEEFYRMRARQDEAALDRMVKQAEVTGSAEPAEEEPVPKLKGQPVQPSAEQ